MKKKSIIIHEDTSALFEGLDDAEAGQMVKAMIAYQNGRETSLSGTLAAVFQMLKIGLDKDNEAYRERCEKNRDNARKRWDANEYDRIQNDANAYESMPNDAHKEEDKEEDLQVPTVPSKESARARFNPPSVDEVRAYCLERGNGVDAEQFVDFYSAKGWKVGNQGMKDWKAAVRTWEKRDSRGAPAQQRTVTQQKDPPRNYVRRFENERPNNYEEMERELRRVQRERARAGGTA